MDDTRLKLMEAIARKRLVTAFDADRFFPNLEELGFVITMESDIQIDEATGIEYKFLKKTVGCINIGPTLNENIFYTSTCRMLANFGYELPRVAAAQYSASQKRDLSQMEVGDLVFYGSGISHVALYIGDGKVVHALNSNKGIVITDYNYDTPVGVGSYME